MSINILSIDVGMKNLAICLFSITDNIEYKIKCWDVLNLCEEKTLYVERKITKAIRVIKVQNFLKTINTIVKYTQKRKNIKYLLKNLTL